MTPLAKLNIMEVRQMTKLLPVKFKLMQWVQLYINAQLEMMKHKLPQLGKIKFNGVGSLEKLQGLCGKNIHFAKPEC